MASFDIDLVVRRQNLSDRRRQLITGPSFAASRDLPLDSPLIVPYSDEANPYTRVYLQDFNITNGGFVNDRFGAGLNVTVRGVNRGNTQRPLELVEDWENWIRALILTSGGRTIQLPGPDYVTNVRRDADPVYGYRIAESYKQEVYDWIGRIQTGHTVNVRFDDGAQTLTGVPAPIPLVLSPARTAPGIQSLYDGRSEITFSLGIPPAVPDILHEPVGLPRSVPMRFRVTGKGVADRLRISLPNPGNVSLQVGEPTNYQFPKAIGGFGDIVYELTPTLPDGIRFDESQVALIGTARYILEPIRYTLTATDALGESSTVTFLLSFVSELEPEIPDFIYAYTLLIEPRGETPEYRFCTEPVATVMDGLEYEPGVLLNVTRMRDSDGVEGPLCSLAALSDEVLEAALVGDPRLRRATVSLFQYLPTMDEWVLRKTHVGNLGEGAPQSDGSYQIEVEALEAGPEEQIPVEWSHEFQQRRAPGDQFFSELRSLANRGQEFPWGD